MNILFIHQNFPGQFKHLAPGPARQGHDCVALTLRVAKAQTWQGVRILPFALVRRAEGAPVAAGSRQQGDPERGTL